MIKFHYCVESQKNSEVCPHRGSYIKTVNDFNELEIPYLRQNKAEPLHQKVFST